MRPPATTVRRALAGTALTAVALGAAGLTALTPSAQATTTRLSLLGASTPRVAAASDPKSVELGVRFHSDVAGSIWGIRFYKGTGNTGTHSGSLWTTTGRRLAQATFTGETARGWQTVRFATPVAITPKTTYVASYHASRGHYAADHGYFSRQKDSGPLHAGTAGNGAYAYGTGFPSHTYQQTNYYVDVVFLPKATAAPAVAAPAPTAGTAGTTYGWQLTAARTGLARAGVSRASLPRFTGTVRAGMTLSKVKITTPLDLSHLSNVTLDRVWLAPTSGRQALVLGPGTVIKDSDIDGSAMPVAERDGIYGNSPGTYAIARVNITGMTVGAWLDGDGGGAGTMTDTYIHGMVSNGGQHMDGFTRRAGTAKLSIQRCRIDATGPSVTGAFFLQNTWGGRIAGIGARDTFLEGSGYVLTLENKGAGTSVGFANVRLRATGWGPVTATPMSGNGPGAIAYTTWSQVDLYDGTRLPTADGRALSHP